MSKQPLPDLSSLDILDNDDLFTIQTPAPQQRPQPPQAQQSRTKQPAEPVVDETTARENALKAELESLRRINQVVEGLRASLDKAKSNMETLNSTTAHATHLLQTWTRILSQTEHNQRLILNPAWQGATQDMADAENEVAHRQARDRERQAADEMRRRRLEEERQRKAEEEERRRAEAATRTPSRTGGRSRSTLGSRGGGVSRGSGTAGVERSASAASARTGRAAAMQYGRVGSVGTKAARGRGRGVG